MNKRTILITKKQTDERIDKVLTSELSTYSRTEIQAFIKDKYVKVNGNTIKANYRCQIDDRIDIHLPEKEDTDLEPENIPLDIVYEDEQIIVLNKPKGMVVHPTDAHPSETLVNALLYHTDRLSSVGGKERPGIVHRLDKDTSGVLVVAKTDNTHQFLAKQFKEQRVERIYGAIVHGKIMNQQGIIRAPIGRDENIRTKMAVREDGRKAITNFTVKERFKNYTYVECELKTGRTHQIRVHMNYIGHSIVGDPVYHKKFQEHLSGQLLFAKSLRFVHPQTKEEVSFSVPMPKEFKDKLQNLGVDKE